MESSDSKNKNNVEGDRLSNLPDDLLHKILSYVDIKQAIEISGLSSRWRYFWTTMPSLNFSDIDFFTSTEFPNFVTHVLSRRNNQIEVSSANLTFYTCLSEKEIQFPLFFFRSLSLKHLTLNGNNYKHPIICPLSFFRSWELPTLTTLKLDCVKLYVDDANKCVCLFSNYANLKNLTLEKCVWDFNDLNLYHPGLSSLTLKDVCRDINVNTPQLKSLVIKRCRRIHLITAPNLFSLRYKAEPCYYNNDSYYDYDDGDSDEDDYDDDFLKLSTKLLQLEYVNICINRLYKKESYTRKIVCMLKQLHSVKCLTLNLELLELLSSFPKIISHQPSPFVNLKTLKIYPADLIEPKLNMSSEVKNFLLDSSPDATLTMVSHEEIRTMMNVTLARNLMTKLHEQLDELKEISETNTAHMKQDMTTTHEQVEVENHCATKIKCHFWGDLRNQFERGYSRTKYTISLLCEIKEVLTKLPASHHDKLHVRF